MTLTHRCALAGIAASLALAGWLGLSQNGTAQEQTVELRPAASFADIADPKARSLALFEEAGKVLQHPRCVNCHPAGDRPLQGMAMLPHQPPVFRGEDNFGLTGMKCNTCHGPQNVDLMAQADGVESIPGHESWHLAPIEMAWEKKSLGEICRQIKDVDRNGGKDMAALVHHMAEDSLVGWGWHPGKGREPAPGTQKEFGALISAWAETGAECPPL
ncbi:hypothetical protein FHS85_001116 [Rhodoligotrophos appendicifer]|uniref:Isoquinoline 1-oxidoreductase subunit n=1 Tax=Rhodoligotrophos appendicifer TaxID=987056 RepID=UPI0011872DDD|nr:Isoquinoline 1-oxidoreductase subunit [Rhodoligotrophos appendicifer]